MGMIMVSSFCMISEKMNGEITRSWHKLLLSGIGLKGYSQRVPGSVPAWGPAKAKAIHLLIFYPYSQPWSQTQPIRRRKSPGLNGTDTRNWP